MIEEHVARGKVFPVAPFHDVAQNGLRLEPQLGGGGHRLAHVVGLHAANSDDGVHALGQRVGYQELELARLVATEGEPRAVIALNVD